MDVFHLRTRLVDDYQRYTRSSDTYTRDLSEELIPPACTGPATAQYWLAPEEGERLPAARPGRNRIPTAIATQLGLLVTPLPKLQAASAP